MTAPDRRALAAARMVENLAHEKARAVEHILAEFVAIDGHPAATDTPGRGGAELTTVEAAAAARLRLQADLTQLDEDIATIATITASALEVARRVQGIRIPRPDIRICDGRGLEGCEYPWTPHSRDPDNGWYDPNCREAADESGLCPRCRIRERRWREAHNLAPRDSNAGWPAA